MPIGKVLVVDDLEINLRVAEELLWGYGLDVETAPGGYEAIKRVRAGETYDVIFMDHLMPRMDGIEVERELRRIGYKGAVIALTASVTGSDDIFLQNGFDGVIPKPIDERRVEEILAKFVFRFKVT
jgi:CheY-like chemotaxis protein